MAKKYYNGHLLPDIEPLWDKTIYPYAYISICDAENTGLPVETGLTGRYAHLVLIDTAGYIRIGDTGYNNAYVANAEITVAKTFVIALDDDAVASLSSLFQGINKETWTETTNYYQYEAAAGEGPHWTNTTLYDADGNLFLEASDPVAYFDLKAWLTGYALGLCGKPLPFSKVQKVPVAYLYNGVRLPKLPEWDRVAYPYASISCFSSSKSYYTLRLFSTDAHYTEYGNKQWVFMGESGGVLESQYWVDKAFTWSQPEVLSGGAYINMTNPSVIWVDFDLLDRDGSIFLAASDPVPVYE